MSGRQIGTPSLHCAHLLAEGSGHEDAGVDVLVVVELAGLAALHLLLLEFVEDLKHIAVVIAVAANMSKREYGSKHNCKRNMTQIQRNDLSDKYHSRGER